MQRVHSHSSPHGPSLETRDAVNTPNDRMPSVSQVGIVIIGRNEGERLAGCLQSTTKCGAVNVYVDSGSTDASVELATRAGVTVVELAPTSPFTAARARNAGLKRLLQISPNLMFVQFIDGDCELRPGWLERGLAQLAAQNDVAVVFGQLHERFPEQSVYNHLCDLEWDRLPGDVQACGGVATMRVEAITAVGGFNEGMIAGEEPELCRRLRHGSWRICCISAPMAFHDATISQFGQWWKRAVRSGHAHAEYAALCARGAERNNRAPIYSACFWALAVPVTMLTLVAVALFATPWAWLGAALSAAAYPLLLWRIYQHRRRRYGNTHSEAALYAVFCVLAKWPQCIGVARYNANRHRRRQTALIEYKRPDARHTVAASRDARREATRASTLDTGTAAPSVPVGAPPMAADPHLDQVGVVVIGRNEGERLKRCLTSLSRRAEQIVYVDSGSTDGSVEAARAVGAAIVELDTSTPFTMARARNAGLNRLLELHPNLEYVQFVDGDCEVVDGWLGLAHRTLAADPRVVAVAGRRRERFPARSIYNRLCDMEWDGPIGEVASTGGDVMMRVSSIRAAGGFDERMIAGEEAELFVRLRTRGGIVLRLATEMTRHDAAMARFGQWWRRAVRTGHAYAEGARLHGRGPEYHNVRPVCSALFWGLAVPAAFVLAIAVTWTWPRWSLAAAAILLGSYSVLALRIYRHRRCHGNQPKDALLYAGFCVLAKYPQVLGVLHYCRDWLLRKQSVLIDYKRPSSKLTAIEKV